MRASFMKTDWSPVVWWGGEMLLALVFQFVPALTVLVSPDGAQGGLMIYALFFYVVQPLAALALPFYLTKKKRVNAYASFFPIGLCLLVSPAYAGGTGMGLLCLALGLISAATGEESKKRAHKQKGDRT